MQASTQSQREVPPVRSGEKSDLRTVSRKWGGVSEGAAGKHSGFQNNPGFEMLDSGPFLKLGVGVGDTDQFGATRTRRRNGPDRGSGTASGEGDPEKATKLGSAAGLEPRREGPACWTQGKGKASRGSATDRSSEAKGASTPVQD